jgi:hypothetical protein
VALADVYGLVAGGAAATAVLFRKQVQYRQQYGIGEFFLHIRIGKR